MAKKKKETKKEDKRSYTCYILGRKYIVLSTSQIEANKEFIKIKENLITNKEK
jgi:hypothetical protein